MGGEWLTPKQCAAAPLPSQGRGRGGVISSNPKYELVQQIGHPTSKISTNHPCHPHDPCSKTRSSFSFSPLKQLLLIHNLYRQYNWQRIQLFQCLAEKTAWKASSNQPRATPWVLYDGQCTPHRGKRIDHLHLGQFFCPLQGVCNTRP